MPQDRELTDLRTPHSKTFELPNGQRRLDISRAPRHYRDDHGKMQDIDPTWRQTGAVIECRTAPYVVTIHKKGVGFDVASKSGGRMSATLVSVGGAAPADVQPVVSGNTVTFPDVATDTDIVFRLFPVSVKSLRILKSANAPRVFVWQVDCDEAGKAKIVDRLVGRDANKRQLELSSTGSTGTITETWTGRVLVKDPATRIKTPSNDAAYPVRIDPTFSESISDTLNDGGEYTYGGGPYWKNDRLNVLGWSNGPAGDQHVGWRFPGITIDQGSSITSATLSLQVSPYGGLGSTAGAGLIYGANVDDAPVWDTSPDYKFPSTTAKTTAKTTLSRPATAGLKTYSVTSIVQEIVNRGGWSNGNALALFALSTEAHGGHYQLTFFYDYTGTYPTYDPSLAASLSITYSAGGGGTTYTQSLSGSLTPSGAIAKAARKVASGSCTPSGAIAKAVSKPIANPAAIGGTLVKAASKALSGMLTLSVVIAKTASKGLAGTCSAAGSVVRSAGSLLTGTITASASLAKAISINLSATISALASFGKLIGRAIAGLISLAGAIALLTSQQTPEDILLPGRYAPDGDFNGQTDFALAGCATLASFEGRAEFHFEGRCDTTFEFDGSVEEPR